MIKLSLKSSSFKQALWLSRLTSRIVTYPIEAENNRLFWIKITRACNTCKLLLYCDQNILYSAWDIMKLKFLFLLQRIGFFFHFVCINQVTKKVHLINDSIQSFSMRLWNTCNLSLGSGSISMFNMKFAINLTDSFEQTLISSPKDALCQVLLKLAKWFIQKKIFYFDQCIFAIS